MVVGKIMIPLKIDHLSKLNNISSSQYHSDDDNDKDYEQKQLWNS